MFYYDFLTNSFLVIIIFILQNASVEMKKVCIGIANLKDNKKFVIMTAQLAENQMACVVY